MLSIFCNCLCFYCKFEYDCNCFWNPLFGQIAFLFDFTNAYAYWYGNLIYFMTYAITKLELRETPAAQWTNTFLPYFIRSEIQSLLLSKRCTICWSMKSPRSCFKYSILSNWPSIFLFSKGVNKKLPQTHTARIWYFCIVYRSMAAS